MPKSVKFSDLWVGDRFLEGERLWTKISAGVARCHGPESLLLGDRGYGYIGDNANSFDGHDVVQFIPPTLKST